MSDLDLKMVEKQLLDNHKALEGFIEKSNGELKELGRVQGETQAAIEKLSEKGVELGDRLAEMEQRAEARFEAGAAQESIGERFTKTDAFQALSEGRQATARMDVKTAIVNATGQNQPLVPADRRPGIIHEPNRVLRIRDVLPVGRTSSNLVEYAKENVFTSNAGPQVGGSPEAFENVTKPESAITFTLASAAVTTLAHWIPASRQVLSDAPMLQSYINGRLIYGLLLKEEDQFINGTGANGELGGLLKSGNFTAHAQADSPESYTTSLDFIRDAKRQAAQSNYSPDVVVLNPKDWSDFELAKDSQGNYLFGSPHGVASPSMWGMSVVATNSIAAGTALVMSSQSAQIWDREDATIEVSRENSDNFVKNMVTILAEERLAFTVYRPAGVIKVTLA